MSLKNYDPSKINVGITFLSTSVIGIIIALYIVKDIKYRASIIISFFILGAIIAGMELAVIVRQSNKIKPLTKEEKEEKKRKRSLDKNKQEFERNREKEIKMAKYVSKLFDEDIPFEEVEKEETKK